MFDICNTFGILFNMNYINIRTFLRDYAICELPCIITRFGKPIFMVVKPDEFRPVVNDGVNGTVAVHKQKMTYPHGVDKKLEKD